MLTVGALVVFKELIMYEALISSLTINSVPAWALICSLKNCSIGNKTFLMFSLLITFEKIYSSVS